VPFDLLATNHMVVNAKLNGKGPYRLIFDLGALITLLSNRASEGAGVIKKDAPRSLLFSMRGEAEVDRLEVGGLTVKRLPVIIMDHPALKALGGFFGRPLDGIIGYTFFARYKTTIDYQTRQMTFEPVNFEVRNLMRDLPQRLAGPKVEQTRVLAPGAFFGLTVGEPANGLDALGVPVKAVVPDSPAAVAGLEPGDVLTTLAGRWTTSVADVYAAAATATPGRGVPAVFLRAGREQTVTITPRAGL
jgi:membrane-associated protease RseP (regulator of RpoE activity)